MRTELELITVEKAQKLLKNNKHNRKLNEKHVKFLADQIRMGLWKLTGETIQIGLSGRVLDGQHRLHAVIKSGIATQFLLVRDANDNAFDVIDTGKNRSAGDILYIDDISNAASIASGIKKYLGYQAGYSSGAGRAREFGATNQIIKNKYYDRPDFWQESHKLAAVWYRNSAQTISQSDLLGLYAYFFDIHIEDAEGFFNALCNGSETKSTATNLLRTKMIYNKTSQNKLTTQVKTALFFKAWNFYRRAKDVKLLKYTSEEKFPQAI